MPHKINISTLFLAISVTTYIASLCLEPYEIANRTTSSHGIGLLLLGWLGLIYGCISWLANPILFASWVAIFIKRKGHATFYASLATLLMLSFLLYKNEPYVMDAIEPITDYFLGYYLWVISGISAIACGATIKTTENN